MNVVLIPPWISEGVTVLLFSLGSEVLGTNVDDKRSSCFLVCVISLFDMSAYLTMKTS